VAVDGLINVACTNKNECTLVNLDFLIVLLIFSKEMYWIFYRFKPLVRNIRIASSKN